MSGRPDDPAGWELLPEQTRDDTDGGWGEDDRGEEERRLRELVEDRPPHHDRGDT